MTDSEIITLSKALVCELVGSLGLPRDRFHGLVYPLFRRATDRLAWIGVTFDRLVREAGFPKAAQWALTNFCERITVRGMQNIPAQGPLLVISNHPGTYDSLVVASQLGRSDLCYITGDIPFLKKLPHAHEHFFFVTKDGLHERMLAARRAVRHLQEGGALLLFGSGHIDPDPAVYPGAAAHIERWFASIDVFLRHVPGVQVLLDMVSGVISPQWARHPITWLRRDGVDKRRLANFGQVISQLVFPGQAMFSPFVSFAQPLDAATLQQEGDPGDVLPAVIEHAKELLAEHCLAFGGNPA
jgi:hypothetical protein